MVNAGHPQICSGNCRTLRNGINKRLCKHATGTFEAQGGTLSFMTWITVKLEVFKSFMQQPFSVLLGHHKKSTSKSLKNVLCKLAHQLLVALLVILWSLAPRCLSHQQSHISNGLNADICSLSFVSLMNTDISTMHISASLSVSHQNSLLHIFSYLCPDSENLYESLVVNGTLTIPVTAGVREGGSWKSRGDSDPWQIHYSWFTMGL